MDVQLLHRSHRSNVPPGHHLNIPKNSSSSKQHRRVTDLSHESSRMILSFGAKRSGEITPRVLRVRKGDDGIQKKRIWGKVPQLSYWISYIWKAIWGDVSFIKLPFWGEVEVQPTPYSMICSKKRNNSSLLIFSCLTIFSHSCYHYTILRFKHLLTSFHIYSWKKKHLL